MVRGGFILLRLGHLGLDLFDLQIILHQYDHTSTVRLT